ncbi:MAG: flagellar hook-basal body complex protein FliE [Pseudomonadales bacterium]|nr:flagellar hook-basal body complex protein FliE [Pseudomonadales bacterium]
MSLNVDMNRMLAQMKAMQQAASLDRAQSTNLAPPISNQPTQETEAPSFGNLFKQAIDQVNEAHQESGRLSKAYVQGDPNVDITRVMVASQKSGIASQAMIQVRNKLVESYKEIMNMPV